MLTDALSEEAAPPPLPQEQPKRKGFLSRLQQFWADPGTAWRRPDVKQGEREQRQAERKQRQAEWEAALEAAAAAEKERDPSPGYHLRALQRLQTGETAAEKAARRKATPPPLPAQGPEQPKHKGWWGRLKQDWAEINAEHERFKAERDALIAC